MSALVNSKMQMLNEDEILSIAAQETGSEYSPEQVKAALLAEVYEGESLLIREGNTFFVIKETNNPEVILVRPLNADTIDNFLDNIIKLMQIQLDKNIPYAVVDFTDDRILSLVKAVYKKSQGVFKLSYSVKRTDTGAYRVIFKIAQGGGLPVERE